MPPAITWGCTFRLSRLDGQRVLQRAERPRRDQTLYASATAAWRMGPAIPGRAAWCALLRRRVSVETLALSARSARPWRPHQPVKCSQSAR
jgi:hypothetical protein